MLKGYNKYTVASAAVKRKNFIEKSDLLGNNNSSLTAGNAILPDMDNDLLEGLIQYDDPKVVYKMYRDVYYHDAIAGTAVDIQSNMPFGEFSLTGIDNKDMMNTFENSIANLRLKSLMPNLTRDYMVMGAHISIPIFDSNKRIYTSLIPINIELCDFKPTPFFGDDPLIDVKLSKTLKDYISNNDPRMKRIARSFPKWFIEGINRGKILLDPQNVLYIPRRVFSTSSMGTSYLRRILPIFLLEKALLRGTIDQAYKRQRPIGLVKAGDDDWEPTNDEFSNLVNLFQMADMDPVGAIIGIPNTVTYEEVRTGSDFWKIEDIHSAYTQEVKYKALGISEALLSSEVNFACVTGDTLIPTENGLLRIDEIGNINGAKKQDINIKVGSVRNPANAKVWLNNGKAPVITITNDLGNEITCTPTHPLLVLRNGQFLKIKAKDLTLDDYTILNTTPVYRTKSLKLNLTEYPYPKVIHGGAKFKDIIKPEYMTPELASLIGLFVSEGWYVNDINGISLSNSNLKLLNIFEQYMEKIFNINCYLYKQNEKGTKQVINGIDTIFTNDYYNLRANSKYLAYWFKELGIKNVKATKKEVPWSILQADKESQLAFLVAYIEGDGHLNKEGWKYSWASHSKNLLKQMQAILNNLGYPVRRHGKFLYLTRYFSMKFYDEAKKYFINKHLPDVAIDEHYKRSTRHSIPIKWLKDFVDSRKLSFDKFGSIYLNDKNKEINLKISPNPLNHEDNFSYEKYEEKGYDKFLTNLKLISESTYDYIINLFDLNYHYSKITKISKLRGKKNVYDLSMNSRLRSILKGYDIFKEPYYIINGLIGGNTIEQSLSFFIEQIKYYREDVTREIYYERLFPTLSVVNDYRKDGRSNTILANITKEELETYNTIGRNKYSFFKDGKFVVHCNDKVRLQEIDDINQYIIPKINWHKRLEPRADREYIDILNEMTEKGLPIPLRMLAASAGLSLDDILEASDTDIKDREKIGDIMEEINDINKKAGVNSNEEENNYGDNYASINTKNKKMIKNRDFTNISKINKNNKYKEDRINKDIAKAKSRINKLEMQKENMNNVRKREYSFKSRLGL